MGKFWTTKRKQQATRAALEAAERLSPPRTAPERALTFSTLYGANGGTPGPVNISMRRIWGGEIGAVMQPPHWDVNSIHPRNWMVIQ